MESLLHHDAAMAEPSARPAIEGLSFHPVFSSDGLVLEYAVAIPARHDQWRRNVSGQPSRLAHEALAFFQSFPERIPFSLHYGDHPPRIGWSATEVCASNGLVLNRNELRRSPNQSMAPGFDIAYPASLVTFHTPLVSHLYTRSYLLPGYAEFPMGLRIRIIPAATRSGASPHGAVQVIGLHVKVPPGFSEFSSLRNRFFILQERAALAKLPVLVSNVDHAPDLHWMRMFPELRFQGSVLASPMGAGSLKALLALSGSNWRDFRVGGRYPQGN